MTAGTGVPDDEPTSGVAAADEDGALDESAGLAAGADFELSRDDARTLGKDLKFAAGVDVAVDVAAAADVAAAVDPLAAGVEAVWLGVGVVQGAVGAGLALGAVGDGLACWLGLEVAVTLGVELSVAVTLGVELSVAVTLGLELPPSEGLAPGLAAPLLSSPLDDTAGLVVTASCDGELALPDEPDAVGVADARVEAGGQVTLVLGMLAKLLDEGPALVDAGAAPWPSVDPAPDEAEVPLMTELKFEERWAISLRVEGTTARTTPRANTARPVAKAGGASPRASPRAASAPAARGRAAPRGAGAGPASPGTGTAGSQRPR